MTVQRSSLSGWLQLLRPPNLPTVPGDPLAGFLLAWYGEGLPVWRIATVAASALLVYAGGLILNDCADVAVDRRERPSRPIPSGRVPRGMALPVALVLLAAGGVLAFRVSIPCGAMALLLIAAVVLYDVLGKRYAVVGAFSMGLCRGLSLLMGWAAAGGPLTYAVAVAAGGLVLYVAAVTCIARRETEPGIVGMRRWGPFAALGVLVGMFALMGADPVALLVGGVALLYTAAYALRLGGERSPAQVSEFVGALIRGLILVQIFFCMNTGPTGARCALVLVLMMPLSSLLARRFYAS